MTRTHTYIILSIILTLVVGGLLGWSIYIGKQQQSLAQGERGVFVNTGGNTPFGGVFGGIIDTVTNAFTPNRDATPDQFQPVLQQLYNLPTAGFAIVGTSTVRFTDRATGHIFEKDVFGQTATRIDQSTTPRVYESLFVEGASHVIRRVVADDGTLLSIYAAIDEEEGSPLFLPAHISSLVTNQETTQIAYVLLTQEGSSLIVSNPDGSQTNELFRSTLRGWNIQWIDGRIMVTQKATASIGGSAFTLSVPGGAITPLALNEQGLLTLMSPDGRQTLVSNSRQDQPPALALLQDDGERKDLYVSGIPTKCVWSKDSIRIFCGLGVSMPPAHYPDAWFQGTVQFSDSLWVIDTQEGTLTQIAPISGQGGVALDMIDLELSEDESVLVFKNKTDQTLWSLTLTEPATEGEGASEVEETVETSDAL